MKNRKVNVSVRLRAAFRGLEPRPLISDFDIAYWSICSGVTALVFFVS